MGVKESIFVTNTFSIYTYEASTPIIILWLDVGDSYLGTQEEVEQARCCMVVYSNVVPLILLHTIIWFFFFVFFTNSTETDILKNTRFAFVLLPPPKKAY